MAPDSVGADQDVYREVTVMGLSFLIFFAAGYWMAGLVIYTDRMLMRVPSPFKRRMMRIGFFDLLVAFLVCIVKFGGT